MAEPRFPLGQVVSTAGALNALLRADQDSWEFQTRHASGDWGELDDDDCRENDRSLNEGYFCRRIP